MAKKKDQKKTSVKDMFASIRESIVADADAEPFIPDIITFCNSEEYLGLPHDPLIPIHLFPAQTIALKMFYRGSIGNEDITLTPEEIKWVKTHGLVNEEKGDLLTKLQNNTTFIELVLVWGRRSGKDFIASLIALYEAMKLIECPGGDPYRYYNIAKANPITILTIANNETQAHLAFEEIRNKVINSKYFKNKFLPKEGIGAEKIFLLTTQDKRDNIEYKERGIPEKKGSILVEVGNSNSAGMVGKSCIVLILDEMATYKQTAGVSGDEYLYNKLTPSLRGYVRQVPKLDSDGNPELDDDGEPIIDRVYDGKIICISSPRGKQGKFFELYESSPHVDHRLMIRLSTWEANPRHSYASLRKLEPDMSEPQFMMEYGAEFSGTAGEKFFPPDFIKACFENHPFQLMNQGQAGRLYFLHLDPATTSDNYGLVVLHKEYDVDPETKQVFYYIVVDHIKHWRPSPNKPVDVDEVDAYVIGLSQRFRLSLVTYDSWNSLKSIEKLKKHGIPNKMTQFHRKYKMKIYTELRSLIISDRVKIPQHSLLKAEMENLQRKFDNTGFSVFPKEDEDGVNTDDLIDCLAGATYASLEYSMQLLPKSRIVDMPMSSSNSHNWMSMQGVPYGTGNGQTVANSIAKMAPFHPMFRKP